MTLGDGRSAEQVERDAVEQFTVHAPAFAAAPVSNDEQALRILEELAALSSSDRVVDVACGPGIVTRRLAARAATVTGVDLTPAMIRLALERSAASTDTSTYVLGRMDCLPFPDDCFDVVVNRYALHHAADPRRVAAELTRVAAPTGRLVIVDFAAPDDDEVGRAYDDTERMRDPSHVRNLTSAEQQSLFAARGWRTVKAVPYRVAARLGPVLANSHGTDHAAVRQAFEAATASHGLGVGARWVDGDIAFEYPLVAQLFEL